MESRNLVVRIPDRNDKRIKLVYLTPLGKAHKEELFNIIQTFNDELVEDIPKENLDSCLLILDGIIEKLLSNTVANATIKSNIG